MEGNTAKDKDGGKGSNDCVGHRYSNNGDDQVPQCRKMSRISAVPPAPSSDRSPSIPICVAIAVRAPSPNPQTAETKAVKIESRKRGD